ncbi:DUF7507 domain-containing protein [Sulfurovum riftiae]|uniref:DUF11 domain-containing protein n=1 Tax=Sulfurovum riftiae TaxID=1630136 RepID=A0A151CIS6_9BACT|nr:hypothetical protein [Sulfurovum riftiae]KYJ87426.1 hypothetical protein AS592_09945 [Sulfurovum riftiae]
MKLIDKHSWLSRVRKTAGGLVVGASLLLAATSLEAKISIDLQGCNSSNITTYEGKLVPDMHPGHDDFIMYQCNKSAYKNGWLGKNWAELDMVPMQLFVENSSDTPADISFKVGGDYIVNRSDGSAGWDYITEFTLDVEATLAANKGDQSKVDQCKQHGAVAVQSLEIGTDEATIYRVVEIKDFPANLICVPMFNMRLAIGARKYPGASLHAELLPVGDTAIGKQDLSIPVKDLKPQILNKGMSAAAEGSRTWSIEKNASVNSIDFGDLCADDNPLQEDIDITITWKKSDVTPEGMVNVQTVISANNPTRRPQTISVHDVIRSGDTPLDSFDCPEVTLAENTGEHTICTHTVSIDAANATNLNDIATATYTLTNINEPTATLTATALVRDEDIKTGTIVENNATIVDKEHIDGKGYAYSVEEVNGANGTFGNNYQLKDVTNGEVWWTSALQENSNSVTFKKRIYVEKNASTEGHLGDTATLNNEKSSSFEVLFRASRIINFNLTKNILEAKDTDTDFHFTIQQPDGSSYKTTLTVPAGKTSASQTFTNVLAGIYNIQEDPKTGWQPANGEDTFQIVNLTNACRGSATFTNEPADQFINVKVRKKTFPDMIGDEDQSAGWTMILKKEVDGNWVEVSRKATVAGDWVILANQDNLDEGTHYRIDEEMKDGWYFVNKTTNSCEFTYEGPEQQDYECTYANAKESKIIIHKKTDGDTTTKFNFSQNIDFATALQLSGGESQTYENLKAGTYTVTEEDMGEHFALSGLSCIDPSSNSRVDINHRTVEINLDPGETVECTFNNIAIKDEPSVYMYKTTNDEDADDAPGPDILVGDTITWNYVITNNGNVKLTNIVVTDDIEGNILCPSTILEPGESMTCSKTGIATLGQYENTGTVTADGDIQGSDVSHYNGIVNAVAPEEDENCPCNDIQSDSSSAMGNVSAALMILMTLMLGLYFVRREELNRAKRQGGVK